MTPALTKIVVTDDPEVHATKRELAFWQDEYHRRYAMFAGNPPTLGEFIRRERTKRPLKERIAIQNG